VPADRFAAAPADNSPLHLRIRGVENLEAAVQQETGLPVGAHPAADGVTGLQDLHRHPGCH
jgi:hypothetical protein